MFRTKLAVDRHVQELFRKVKDEKERNLRCYNLAKLYYQVGDYESARRYVSSYLEVKSESAVAHKLLGQISEGLGQKEQALSQYKQSLELDGRQDDLVLKVCQLLTEVDISLDINRIKYWIDRAAELFPHHPTVFQLKEKILTSDGSIINDDLESLIMSEVSVRPGDVNLRVKLIKYYMSKRRMEDAYKHAVDVECTYTHHHSITWYECLYDLLFKMKGCDNLKWSFWVFLVTASERYTALSLTEHGDKVKSISDAQQILFNFDQILHEAKSKMSAAQDANLAEKMFSHMWGQLNYHLACLVLRKAKREQKNWPETVRLCCPLLLSAIHSAVIDPEASWTPVMKAQALLWFKDGSYRCSQAGHVLAGHSRDNSKRMIDRISEFMTNSWRENTYRKIFVGKYDEQKINTSHFVKNTTSNPSLRLLSSVELRQFDDVAKQLHPESLHHHVWFGVAHQNLPKSDGNDDEPYPNEASLVFSGLQLSVYNLSHASPDSLGVLDVDAFLNSTILYALRHIYDQTNGGLLNPERMNILPADLTNPLCSSSQEKWWNLAYKMYKKLDSTGDAGDIRQEIQRGLEIIRCIDNHGLHINILVHLARMFQYRTQVLRANDDHHPDINFILARTELYWSSAIPLLERMLNNQQIRMTTNKMFDYSGKEMTHAEVNQSLEDGQLMIAQKCIREKQYEQAINILQGLKCPDASYYQGDIYQKLAAELIDGIPKESVTMAIKDQRMIMLTKARNCYYLTLDRLRSPSIDPNHPLNAELGTRLAQVEDQLWNNESKNNIDPSDDSYTSAHSLSESMNTPVNQNYTSPLILTPRVSRITRQSSSTPRLRQPDMMEQSNSKVQIEARPSPERLDAQIRQLLYTKDNVIHGIMDQQKVLLESNKMLTESNKQLQKMVEDLRKDLSEFKLDSTTRRQPRSTGSANHHVDDDQSFLFDDDFSMLQSNTPIPPSIPTPHIPSTLFPPRPPYSSLIYPNPQPGGYYQGLPFTDYTQQSLQSFYTPNVYQLPGLYARATEQALGVPRMPEMLQQNMLNPGMFNARTMPMFTDLMTSQPQPPPFQVQNLDINRTATTIPNIGTGPIPANIIPGVGLPITTTNVVISTNSIALSTVNVPLSTIKNTFVNRAPPPVNVVITSSDILPTNVPVVQSTLSVVIPPQHRNVNSSTVLANTMPVTITTSAPHNYQILMPSHPAVPTTVNIPSIFNTVNSTLGTGIAPLLTDQNSKINISTQSAASLNSSHDNEIEHDPIPDFVPVIPLPAEVKVTTGEEDEVELFCARAKLFRFADKEWKDRGVGNVKLLKNKEGKIRLLMRRDQVLKICANHLLTPDMELSAMPNNDKAWMWAANDFADEEVKLEKLCIKFKLVQEAQSFKEHFDKAKNSVPHHVVSTDDSQKIAKPPETAGKTDVKISSTVKMGGFSFSSTPVIQPLTTVDSVKSNVHEEPAKPSPFAAFSFTKTDATASATATSSSSPFSGFSTIKTTKADDKLPSFGTAVVTKASTPSVIDTTITKPPLRRPHSTSSPSPGPTVSGVIIDNDEAVLFSKNASLVRCVGEPKQWKDRGVGPLMLIMNLKTGIVRLIMKKSNSAKTAVNTLINKSIIFMAVGSSPNVICWAPTELSSSGKQENYAASFEIVDEAGELIDKISKLQKLMTNNRIAPENINRAGKTVIISLQLNKTLSVSSSNTSTKSLSEMFKPAAGSWECTGCYTRNNAGTTSCIACEATSVSAPVALAAPTNSQVPLSQLFKPPAGSWECKGCYTRNTSANKYCLACEGPSDPSLPPKSKADDGKIGTTFTFGMPQVTASATQSTTQFGFGASGFGFKPAQTTATTTTTTTTQGSIFGYNNLSTTTAPTSTTTPSFSFGTAPSSGVSNNSSSNVGFSFKALGTDVKQHSDVAKSSKEFVFGNTQKLETPNNAFSFGSPGKSFDFQLTSSKSPVKSPGCAEASEDEVAESDDVYFTPVIPLPDKIDVKTGEEDEQILYKHRAKLFRYDSNTKEWKERGLGDIKLLKNLTSSRIRLVMRREQTLKLCLNHLVMRDLEITSKDEKTWMWNAADYSDGEIEYLRLACRFKTSDIAGEFKQAVYDAIDSLATIGDTAYKSSCDIDKRLSSDVQVIYELKVSEEDKDAALKLQLPENFYAYKQRQDCPGCLGCREPDVSLFGDTGGFNRDTSTTSTPISIKLTPAKLTSSPSPSSNQTVSINTTSSSISPVSSSTSSTATTTFTGGFGTPTSKPFSFGTGSLETTSSSIFSGTPSAGDKNFHFGPSAQESDVTKNLFGGNVSVCSPSTTLDFSNSQAFKSTTDGTSWSFGGKPTGTSNIFGGTNFGSFSKSPSTASSSSITASTCAVTAITTTTVTSSTSSIFCNVSKPGSDTSKSVFSLAFGNSTTTTFGSLSSSANWSFGNAANESNCKEDTSAKTKVFGTDNVPSFSSLSATVTTAITAISTTVTTTTTTSMFGGTFGAKSTAATNVSLSNLSNSKTELPAKTDDNLFFNTDNIVTFSSLAASGNQSDGFKTDPNFSFAGAGQSVFGSKPPVTTDKIQKIPKKTGDDDDNDGGDGDGAGDDDNQEYDPHYEPVIPLPDAVEVRTGEEDEEKIFCQRAKLYRYEDESKEWKERGVGEMKVLYHAQHGTYRLLLRREQVHKIVCNSLITADLELQPLTTSDRSWMWIGMNYVDDQLSLEKLAVKFKNPTLANEFRYAVDKAKMDLQQRSTVLHEETNNDDHDNDDDDNDHGDGDGETDDQVGDEEDEEEEEQSLMFDRSATLFYYENGQWVLAGDGQIRMTYDADIFGARIMFITNEGEIISNCVITVETEVQVDKCECIWSTIDDVFEPPTRRQLKAQFSSVVCAQDMYVNFQDGQECARQANISEQGYYEDQDDA